MKQIVTFFFLVGMGMVISADLASAQKNRALEVSSETSEKAIEKRLLGKRSLGLVPPGKKVHCDSFRTRNLGLGKSTVDAVAVQLEFASGSFELSEAARMNLDKLVAVLKKGSAYCFRVEGYTDILGDRIKNYELSVNRAESAAKYLATKGVDEQRLVTVGRGPEKPIASNRTPAGRQRNRRVELSNLGRGEVESAASSSQ